MCLPTSADLNLDNKAQVFLVWFQDLMGIIRFVGFM